MNNYAVKTALSATFFSMVLLFQNCSGAKFTAAPEPSSLNSVSGENAVPNGGGSNGGDDANCRPTTVSTNQIVKVLFVVDTSGSNDDTDLNKQWRSATIQSFISTYQSRSNFHFGMITFQDKSAIPQIKAGGKGVFSQDSSVVKAGVDSFMATVDKGFTPYKAALSLAKSIIAADLAANSAQNASYALVMISDGQATDYGSPDEVIPDAKSIRALAPGQVSLNTVYYYSQSFEEDETKYLRNISSVGGGQFLIANSGQILNIEDVIQVPGASCQ